MDQVLAYLKHNEERFVQELCDYVRFPSVSAQPQHAKDMKARAEWVREHCRTVGLKAELHGFSCHHLEKDCEL